MSQQVQQQARALGDPTRHRIFRHILESEGPVGVAELTELLGLNHNAIRQHLSRLEGAGLVVRTQAPPHGRGRPRLVFQAHPDAEADWGSGGAYQRLSLMLVEMLRSGDTAIEVGRRAGRESDPGAGPGAVERLRDALDKGGFAPVLIEGEGNAEFSLQRCPFVAAAEADPDTVCSLHLGLAQGLAEQNGVVVEALERRHPRRAGCRLRFRLQAS
ncbi:MAG TPA: helix-turn-helix domain-containing protein [Acidimicrobiia bacterium]